MLIVGDRVEVGGNRGTISYIGAIEGYDGEWVGIDWDNPERGKHDGSVKGKRYFQAKFVVSNLKFLKHLRSFLVLLIT